MKLLNFLDDKAYEIDRIRIYDYFLLFPFELNKITMPIGFFEYKKIAKENRFNKIHDVRNIFLQLEGVQELAFNAMISYGFLSKDFYLDGNIKIDISLIPSDLSLTLNDIERTYMEFVTKCFEKMSLRELKERTKLMEYRYELSEIK
ncbi:hypothetical protein IR148_03945 [Dysgonomonas mossii]|uniref:Uncharacterized protein n=1 Tax=Dysgonomonas mossii TaxID=163665 RepID=A0A4Y9IRE8_9BACT|nr:ABC-three component system middle component 5 [Dysgonomonas mossii]MBF0760194.1 hypothetical protein [Dysgonomonas mossii]TFU91143.1 hypothetical protein E4T88_03940 [Dysgonomonas mossii]